MEQWRAIDEFSDYSVSSEGRVRNDDTGRILVQRSNTTGVVYVGLQRNRKQFCRSVPLLVATEFVERPGNDMFDTPINLDGDKWNNRPENLMWRPRWFAIRYRQQFWKERRGYDVPIMDIATGEVYPTSWDAALKFGLLDREIALAIGNRTYVWPTYQRFLVVE